MLFPWGVRLTDVLDMAHDAACFSPDEVLHTTSLQQKEWDTLLHQLEEIQRRMEQRLEAVDVELQYLEAFRGSVVSEMDSGSLPRRRFVTLPMITKAGKRRRDEVPFVGYATAPPRQRGEVGSWGFEPFREAGLYMSCNNPAVRVAPLSLSRDEKVRQEVDYILPSYICPGVEGAKGLPFAAAERLIESLTAAGLDKGDFAMPRTSAGRRLNVRTNPDPSDVKALCAAVSEEHVRSLCCGGMGDSGMIASSLYTELAQQATLRALILPETRLYGVKLLRLPPYRQQLSLEVTIWTLRKCCDCCDRDLAENSLVQWCKALQSVIPETQTCEHLRRDAYATGYYQLLHGLSAASSVRQGYLALVVVVCGTFFDLVEAGKLPFHRKTSPFFFRGALEAVNECHMAPNPAQCS
ncbi:hypothetical protein, conserved [Leishmania tarentolae]|uniref:Uncharacterized protein n=1 Tax=Leishmania tarentolae TaxID=5689 RepID=A0A640KCD2_LEITA|nr:hypothetical protein, conserved [Leishmania tarentolae]